MPLVTVINYFDALIFVQLMVHGVHGKHGELVLVAVGEEHKTLLGERNWFKAKICQTEEECDLVTL